MFGVSEYNPCDYHEGICEQKCSFNDTTNKVTCSCASGYGKDGTNCIPLDGGFVMLTSLDLDFNPPPLPPLACMNILKMKTKLLRETIYQFIIIIFSYILIILWYNKLLFFLGTSTGKTYFWVAASQVLLQFRLDHVVNSTLRLTHSSPEAHYIRTVDFDHRKQLVCWVRNLFKIKSRWRK